LPDGAEAGFLAVVAGVLEVGEELVELFDELLVEFAFGLGEGDGVLLDAVAAVADDFVEGAPDDGALDQLGERVEVLNVLDLFLDAK